MGTAKKRIALSLALVVLLGCAMARHREQIREGLLTRGLHREAFRQEWGPPSRTFAVRSRDAVLRTHPFGARWEHPVYEVWEYEPRATCLTFDGVRLIEWETGRTDCTPKRTSEPTEGKRDRKPPPYPSYPE
jgi:hypothetical protein